MQRMEQATLFHTALGWIGIAWSPAGVTRLQLPGRDREDTQKRLGLRPSAAPAEPPRAIASAVALIGRYCGGESVDLSGVAVDLAGIDAFRLDIYASARQLGYGETTTYGELARRAGHAGLARETGDALGRNPVPLLIPCHRILAAGGKAGGFSAPGGTATKLRLLALEGVDLAPPEPAQASFGF